MMKNDMQMKFAILGESGVGKTSIIESFAKERFSDCPDPTKAASFQMRIVHSKNGKQSIKLVMWDTAGQEIFKSLAPFYYKDADAIFIVFDVTSAHSLEAVDYWLKEVSVNGREDCLLSVVGNKSDLVDKEEVDIDEAQHLAKSRKASFFITSAKENSNIKELFFEAIYRKFPHFDPDASKLMDPASSLNEPRSSSINISSGAIKVENKSKAPTDKKGCSC